MVIFFLCPSRIQPQNLRKFLRGAPNSTKRGVIHLQQRVSPSPQEGRTAIFLKGGSGPIPKLASAPRQGLCPHSHGGCCMV